MQALYINLDRDVERRRFVEGEMRRVGLQATRIGAVDGRSVPSHLATYLHDGTGPVMHPGEIGCYASHLLAWKHIVDSGLPCAVVFEDDAICCDDIADAIKAILLVLPPEWDFVHLSGLPDRAVRPLAAIGQRQLVRYSRVPFGTAAYLMSAAGARKMLLPVARIWPVGLDTRLTWRYGTDAYGVVPPLVRQNKQTLVSSIGPPSARSRIRRGIPHPTRYAWLSNPLISPAAVVFNMRKLGPLWWMRCAMSNIARKSGRSLGKSGKPCGSQATRNAFPRF